MKRCEHEPATLFPFLNGCFLLNAETCFSRYFNNAYFYSCKITVLCHKWFVLLRPRPGSSASKHVTTIISWIVDVKFNTSKVILYENYTSFLLQCNIKRANQPWWAKWTKKQRSLVPVNGIQELACTTPLADVCITLNVGKSEGMAKSRKETGGLVDCSNDHHYSNFS